MYLVLKRNNRESMSYARPVKLMLSVTVRSLMRMLTKACTQDGKSNLCIIVRKEVIKDGQHFTLIRLGHLGPYK